MGSAYRAHLAASPSRQPMLASMLCSRSRLLSNLASSDRFSSPLRGIPSHT